MAFNPRRGRGGGSWQGQGTSGAGPGRGSSYGGNKGSFNPSSAAGRGRGGQNRGGSNAPRTERPIFSFKRVPPDPEVTKIENDSIQAESLVRKAAEMSLEDSLPSRPAFSTAGNQFVVRANHYNLIIPKGLVVFRYSLSFSPDMKLPSRKKGQLVNLLLSQCLDGPPSHLATDYRAYIVSLKRLVTDSQPSREFEIPYQEADEKCPRPGAQTYKVRIQAEMELHLDSLVSYAKGRTPTLPEKHDYLQVINLVIQQHARSHAEIVRSGENRFSRFKNVSDSEQRSLGGGIVGLRGYTASAAISPGRVLVNLNVAAGAFYQEGSLTQLMSAWRGSGGPVDYEALAKFIRRLRVETCHIPGPDGQPMRKVHTIWDLARKPQRGAGPGEVVFQHETKGEITIKEYFKHQYGRLLQDNSPVVNVGNDERSVWMPAELCTVLPGQPYNSRLTGNRSKDMVEFAARPPQENVSSIQFQGRELFGFDFSGSTAHAFGMRVDNEMVSVQARLLGIPALRYEGGNLKFRGPGQWNLLNAKFSECKKMRKWGVLLVDGAFDSRGKDAPTCVKDMINGFNSCGVGIDGPAVKRRLLVLPPDTNSDTYRKEVPKLIMQHFEQMKGEGIELIVFILKDDDQLVYNSVKLFGDVGFGIPTICFIASKYQKQASGNNVDAAQNRVQGYFANIAMKVNLKLGGRNQNIERTCWGPFREKTMIFGIDVTHPSPDSMKGAPSLAAVVASQDMNLAQWPASLHVQQHKEMVANQGLTNMIAERLKAWMNRNGNLPPERVIVYRDGVGESQYQESLQKEVPVFKEAFRKVSRKDIKLTFIIVGKRHDTRFYPQDPADGDQHNGGNTKAGTLVDRGVTMRGGWDFYFQGHVAIKGTARPGHYVVLLDENRTTQGVLEQVTNSLCYACGRATRAISLPAPAYYAHLACERGRRYMHEFFSASPSQRDQQFDISRSRFQGKVHPRLANTMFYI